MDQILYLQKMKQFFVKKGKKSIVEKLFRTFLFKNSINKKSDINKMLIDASMNSMPYIKLKTRRRGKKMLYKVNYLEKEDSLRKGLLAFSKNLNENKNINFLNSFEKELENLSIGKSVIMSKRDEIHRLALENAPYS
jgi:ribosomal protein S7